jgi:hypothetical protein
MIPVGPPAANIATEASIFTPPSSNCASLAIAVLLPRGVIAGA